MSSKRPTSTYLSQRDQRGFTLIELAVVLAIIAIAAGLAMPSLGAAKYERRAYDDSGEILELVRMARTNAVGRGAATMVTFDVSNSNRGIFRMYEAVDPNPTANSGTNRIPRATCTNPTATAWKDGDARNRFLNGLNMNGTMEGDGNIRSRVVAFDGVNNALAEVPFFALCFNAAGRTFFTTTQATPFFDPSTAFMSTLSVDIARLVPAQTSISAANAIGIVRRVHIPSSGNARLESFPSPPSP